MEVKLTKIHRSEYSHPLYVKRMAAFSDEIEEEKKYNELEKASQEVKHSVRQIPLEVDNMQVGSGNNN